ncbi:MAG: creatininase family protein [Candidatus Pedobacter colombiensis]|uniref:Creatininase family protein n=1 Tax=Candidatus Pedobacter colombiensis TaxID=3121371 RepID=A0AAJ5WCL1_9SPHI|nr:creatininase family protein [Pedobacter sp.]WEK20999.1 MAG: creatininase family protein [Pedobacter sp.]
MLFSTNYNLLNKATGNKIALLPIGAIEQHGPHLAVSTDIDLVSEVAKRAEQQLPEDILLCPPLPFGSSHHHLDFGGVMSISAATYTQVLVELVESLLKDGFRRIVLLNGHGGNITPARQALAILSHKYDATLKPNIVMITYWELAGKIFAGAAPMETPALSHACEYETSLMLYLFPDRVWPDQIQRAKRPDSNGYIPWEDDEPYSGVSMVKQTEFISSNGSSGEPQLGTSEKGKHLFDHAVNSLVSFINSFKTWPFMDSLKK